MKREDEDLIEQVARTIEPEHWLLKDDLEATQPTDQDDGRLFDWSEARHQSSVAKAREIIAAISPQPLPVTPESVAAERVRDAAPALLGALKEVDRQVFCDCPDLDTQPHQPGCFVPIARAAISLALGPVREEGSSSVVGVDMTPPSGASDGPCKSEEIAELDEFIFVVGLRPNALVRQEGRTLRLSTLRKLRALLPSTPSADSAAAGPSGCAAGETAGKSEGGGA